MPRTDNCVVYGVKITAKRRYQVNNKVNTCSNLCTRAKNRGLTREEMSRHDEAVVEREERESGWSSQAKPKYMDGERL